ncbi:MAG: hypothetical protein MUF64_27070, partial [Polyangiaceae bacterium]|nr:hypothetical protein [Polyangiaceae bacterium]
MKVIQKSELIKYQGGRALRFELTLCERGADRFVVNYRQGLLDGSTYDGSLTLRPLPRHEAERAFQRAIEKQQREGYQIHSGPPAPPPAPRPGQPPAPAAAPARQGTAPSPPRALTREEKKARSHERARKRILAHLRYQLPHFWETPDKPTLGRLFQAAARLRLQEAEPLLLACIRTLNAPRARVATAVWALGRCGTHASISTLGALVADKKTPEPIHRAAVEVLLALSDDASRGSLRASLREALPEALRAFPPDGDAEAFQLALSEHLASGSDEAHAVIDRLYQISDPVSRPALLVY